MTQRLGLQQGSSALFDSFARGVGGGGGADINPIIVQCFIYLFLGCMSAGYCLCLPYVNHTNVLTGCYKLSLFWVSGSFSVASGERAVQFLLFVSALLICGNRLLTTTSSMVSKLNIKFDVTVILALIYTFGTLRE